jgi:NAD(P)-dependent dehydrogenase (short-subunit alcohol dehydrogenase family)
MSDLPFPLWQVDRGEYAAACRHLGLSPSDAIFDRLSAFLACAPFANPVPAGLSLHLARPPLTRFRIARLDLATRLFWPTHPARHVLNAVIALHECDGRGFVELSAAPSGAAAWGALVAAGARFAAGVLLTLPWLAAHATVYALARPFRRHVGLSGRRVLITGVARGLGRDLLLHCLERGAEVVGTVRSSQSRDELLSSLPRQAPLRVVVADLATPGALSAALRAAGIEAASIDIAIASAGVKHATASALSPDEVRHTFEVNFFAAAELAGWLCRGRSDAMPARKSIVLVSSIGRWHGMHGSGGYNASKAALSIWGESVEMDLRRQAGNRMSVTIVEPGLFASDMTRPSALTRWLFAPRRKVAEAIVAAALEGRRSVRPPFWFALLTWAVCLGGRGLRLRLFGRVKPGSE